MKSDLNKAIPALRFKDDRGEEFREWTKRKIGNICDVNPPSDILPQNFIYIDLESVNSGILVERNIICKVSAPSRAQRLLRKHDVLIQTVRPYQQNNLYFEFDGDYVASTGYAQLRSSESSKFLYFSLHVKSTVNKILASCTGTSYPAINSNDLGNISIYLPQLQEQQKIADFVSSIDTRIEQLKKKKTLFEQYKKGLMQKLFSQKIRFRDDQGKEYPEWEERKVNEVAKILRGSGLSKNDLHHTGSRLCILYGHLFTEYAEVITTIKHFTDAESNVKSIYGDILLPMSDVTPSGLATASALLKDGVQIGGDIHILRLTNGIEPRCISYCINLNKRAILRIVTGITVRHTNAKDIENISLFYPLKIEEQHKIADFLSSIDRKIELLNEQIDKTNEFKRGLLQQMFV